ncbi:MAG: hypothetical protein SNH63_07700 [Rikenellaceae bacterium]
MKKITLLGVLLLSLFTVTVAGAAEQLIVTGHGNPHISIVDMRSSTILWQYDLNEKENCNSLHLFRGESQILFSTQLGARIISLDKEVLWEYKLDASEHCELHCVMPLSNGGFALFIAGTPARIVEYSSDNQKVGEIEFDGVSKSPHTQFRQAAMGKNGNWLISLFAKKGVVEMTPAGEIVAEYKTGGGFGVSEALNGNLLSGMGDGHSMVELDKESNSIVSKHEKLGGGPITLLYIGQYEQIARKRYLIANWSGHNRKNPLPGPYSQLVEFDDKGNITWSWDDEGRDLGMISAFYYSKKSIIK